MTGVNFLRKVIGDGAEKIVAAAKEKGNIETLCGIDKGQTEVDLQPKKLSDRLKAPDAVLLSFDLESHTALTSVNLLYNKFGDGAAAVVAAAAKQKGKIQTLCGIASGQTKIDLSFKTTKRILRAPDAVLLSFDLESNRSLKSADLGGNSIGDEGTAALSEALKSNITLEELELPSNQIGAAGAQSLADMLQFNRALTSVNLLYNDLGEGAAAVAAAAEQQGNIKTLCGIKPDQTAVDFSRKGNGYGGFVGPSWNAADTVLLGFDLKFNRSLKSADLGNNSIGDKGTAALSETLKSNSTLEELKLWGNKIGYAGAQFLANMLQFNRSLTSLDLRFNKIGAGGAKAIALSLEQSTLKSLTINVALDIEQLKTNTSIDLSCKRLRNEEAIIVAKCIEFNRALISANLAQNDIGEEGAAAISKALEKNNTLETLILGNAYGGNNIGAAGAQAIAKMLVVNRGLKSAEFSANSIGDEGTAALSDALNTNSTLKTLELRSNEVGAAGAQSLAGMLHLNRALTALDVRGNDIGDDGKSAIGDALLSSSTSKLQSLTCSEWSIKADTSSLDLRGMRLNAADAKLLAGVIKFNRALTSLDLSSNSIGLPGGWSQHWHSGEGRYEYKHSDGRVQAEFPPGTSAGIIALSESLKVNRSLTSVNLLKNDLGDGAAAVVAAAKQHGKIKTLCGIAEGETEANFFGENLKAPDAVLLSFDLEFNRALKSTDLSGNNMGTDGIRALCDALKTNNSLESLTIQNPGPDATKIGAAGAQLIADMLAVNRALKSAKLDYNDIGDEGAVAISAALELESNTTLEDLSLRADPDETQITAVGAQAIAKMLKVNKALAQLDVRGNDLGDGSAALAKVVSQSQQIVMFCEVPVNGMRDDVLTELDLSELDIGACGAMVVAHLLEFSRALTSVNLLKNDLGDGAAAVVAAAKQHGKIKTLCGIAEGKTEVSFYEQSLKAPDAVLLSFDLEFNRALKRLVLTDNEIGDGGASALSDALKTNNTLEELLLNGYHKVGNIGPGGAKAIASMLAVNRALTSLDLSRNEIGVGGAQAIADSLLPSALQHLTINVALDIKQLKSSTSVDLSSKGLREEEVIIVAKCMEFNRDLKALDLNSNDLGSEGARVLCDALKDNRTLESLDVSNLNGSTSGDIKAEGARYFADMLKDNRALKSANLGSNSIGDEGTTALSEALKSENSTLKELWLYANAIGVAGAQSLANMLQFNKALTSFNLLKNDLGEDGLAYIAAAWEQSTTLKSVCGIAAGATTADLTFQRLDAADARIIALELRFNRALTSVNLLKNNLGGDAAAAIVAAAKQGGNIKTLCGIKEGQTKVGLRSIGLKAPDAVLLSFDLEFNRALKSVDLRYNSIPDEGCRQLRAAVGRKSITLQLEPQSVRAAAHRNRQVLEPQSSPEPTVPVGVQNLALQSDVAPTSRYSTPVPTISFTEIQGTKDRTSQAEAAEQAFLEQKRNALFGPNHNFV